MLSKVTTYIMTEEERLAYIAKHPIKPSKPQKKKDRAFENIGTDYKWRGQKGIDARYGKKSD